MAEQNWASPASRARRGPSGGVATVTGEQGELPPDPLAERNALTDEFLRSRGLRGGLGGEAKLNKIRMTDPVGYQQLQRELKLFLAGRQPQPAPTPGPTPVPPAPTPAPRPSPNPVIGSYGPPSGYFG